MGCRGSQCQDQGEFVLTQPLSAFQDTVVSSIFSDKSTKPSIDTFLRNQKQVKSYPRDFSSILGTAKLYLKDSPHYPDFLSLLHLWHRLVYRTLQQEALVPQDVHTVVALESTGQLFTITHEVDGIRDFEAIRRFCEEMKLLQVDLKLPELMHREYERIEDFLLSLTPLTISFYLQLGEEVDCGIGVNKPMGQTQLSRFLTMVSDAEGLGKWCYGAQPIPVGFTCSVTAPIKTCSLYLFDGEKDLNYDRALSLFDFYGAPLPLAISELLKTASCEEVNSLITYGPGGIQRLGIQVSGLEGVRIRELGGLLETPFEQEKCAKFTRSANNEAAVKLELSAAGFVLTQSLTLS